MLVRTLYSNDVNNSECYRIIKLFKEKVLGDIEIQQVSLLPLSSTIFIMIGINVFSFCYAWLISAIAYTTLPLCRIFHGIDDYHILYKPGCRNKLQEAKQLMLTYIHLPLFIFLSNIYLTNANNFTIYICISYIQIVYQFFRLQYLQRLRMPFYLQS